MERHAPRVLPKPLVGGDYQRLSTKPRQSLLVVPSEVEWPAGSWLVKPRDIPHATWNVTMEPVRILEVVLPGGIERYFEQIAPILKEHGPDWTKRYQALGDEFGLTILDDWSDELTAQSGASPGARAPLACWARLN